MPQLRVQPRAKLLHGLGPYEAVQWFTSRCEAAFGDVEWSVNRLDLFCDVQGWLIDGSDRDRFKCRGRQRALYENGGEFTGVQFGQRSTGTVSARIYDKTAEIEIKGTDYWFDVWGNEMDPELPVLQVEFEIRRRGLKQYSVTTPGEAFASCGGLWKSLSEEWLTFRDRTEDSTEARWPLSPVWRFVQGAELRGSAVGLDRIRAQQATGSVRVLVPAFVGYLAKSKPLVRHLAWPEQSFRRMKSVVTYSSNIGWRYSAVWSGSDDYSGLRPGGQDSYWYRVAAVEQGGR